MASRARWGPPLALSSLRVLELVLQGKRNGHRYFRLSPSIHENAIAYNLDLLARRFPNAAK